ncbi:MAG: hypothetical protein KF764_09490 [Labilithrix sp.]|nr:hypothetical protein [Labilithrix sp.]
MRSLRHHLSLCALLLSAPIGAATLFACASDEEIGFIDAPSDGGADTSALDDAAVADASVETDAPLGPSKCSSDGFCHVPLPAEESLRGVWADGTGIVWAVSREGDVLRWDGNAWAIHSSGMGVLLTIWGSGPTDMWIGGEAGLFHGQGATSASIVFTAVPSDSTIPITSIHGFGPNDVWAVGGRMDGEIEECRVLHYLGPTGDPATDWKLDPISSRPIEISRVWGSTADEVWLGGTTIFGWPQGAVFMRGRPDGDGGTQFEDVVIRKPDVIESEQFLWVTGGIVLSDTFVIGRLWNGIGAAWAGHVEADDAGDPNGVGTFWNETTLDGFGILGVWGRAKDDVWIVGELGRVRHWDGKTWSLPSVTITKFPLTRDLHAIWGSASGEMWIVGDNTVLHRNPSAPKGDL